MAQLVLREELIGTNFGQRSCQFDTPPMRRGGFRDEDSAIRSFDQAWKQPRKLAYLSDRCT